NDRGEVEWIPPPRLDTGQTRINTYHRPERLLRPPEEPAPGQEDTGKTETDDDATPTHSKPTDPQPSDDPGQPGGPAPPGDQAA
ncbi:MAG: hypothetical protein SW019_25375, partial [Actinomycetota bacterium]|nr:hypothetical protein [Actinomycetota bacterium]